MKKKMLKKNEVPPVCTQRIINDRVRSKCHYRVNYVARSRQLFYEMYDGERLPASLSSETKTVGEISLRRGLMSGFNLGDGCFINWPERNDKS